MKKDYEDIPKILKEKYDDVETPHDVFRVEKLDYKVRRRRMKSAASVIITAIVVIVLIAGGIISANLLSNKLENSPNNIQANEENIKYLTADISKSYAIAGTNDYISIVKLEKIEEYCLIDEVAYTKAKVKVIENYKNNMQDDEYIYIPGGQFKASGIKDIVTEEVEENDIINLKYNTTMFLSDVVEGQEYVVGLNEIDGQLVVNTEFKYGFKKYNRKDNTVENHENEYEEFLIENYILE